MVTVTGAHRSERPLLRVRGLSVGFGPVAALSDIDVDVWPGEIVGLAGDNGAGKTTLLRCMSGDLVPTTGLVRFDDGASAGRSTLAQHERLGVVWQHLELADNLTVGDTVLLGRERRRLLASQARTHAKARAILDDLGIDVDPTTRYIFELNLAERQFVAIARAAAPRPRLLVLDEPTAVLSRLDTTRVETLIRRLRGEGSTIALVSHDIEQLFRLADRILVMRHGRIAAELDPAQSSPDEVVAVMAGLDAAAVPRRQLSRLGGLTDRLTSADRPGGLALILTTLAAALGESRLSAHVVDGTSVVCVASVGLPGAVEEGLAALSLDDGSTPVAQCIREGAAVVQTELRPGAREWSGRPLLAEAGVHAWWAVPFSGGDSLTGVISVFHSLAEPPSRDQLDLIGLYAGFAATTLERERLVTQLTERNHVLESIRAVLQTLAGPDAVSEGVGAAVRTLRDALVAERVALYERVEGGRLQCRAYAVRADEAQPDAPAAIPEAGSVLEQRVHDAHRFVVGLSQDVVIVADWGARDPGPHERTLLEDAGHSIVLALDRERAEAARREAAALRRSQDMQRQFLARLSHELRTPLTAIRGYASSLLQPDVTWDDASRHRFLARISTESTRLRRLVDDMLDFSLIESGMLRIRPDWVDLPLVIDAARACLSPQAAAVVAVDCAVELPTVWADHDRLEQVMMNLMDNAVRHNPAGTSVQVTARPEGDDAVVIDVADDGVGIPAYDDEAKATRQRPTTAGAGLGLSITEGIVAAHQGSITRTALNPGTRFRIRLPVEDKRMSAADV